jgi:hypothetical protein
MGNHFEAAVDSISTAASQNVVWQYAQFLHNRGYQLSASQGDEIEDLVKTDIARRFRESLDRVTPSEAIGSGPMLVRPSAPVVKLHPSLNGFRTLVHGHFNWKVYKSEAQTHQSRSSESTQRPESFRSGLPHQALTLHRTGDHELSADVEWFTK